MTVQPNPARGRLVVRYAVPEAGPARVTFYDVLSRAVRTITVVR